MRKLESGLHPRGARAGTGKGQDRTRRQEMGPTTLTDYLSTMSPILWTCGGAVIVVVVIYRVLIRPLIDD